MLTSKGSTTEPEPKTPAADPRTTETAKPAEKKPAKAEPVPFFDPTGLASQPVEQAPAGARQVAPEDLPTLLAPDDPKAKRTTDPDLLAEAGRTKELLDQQPKVMIQLPQRAQGQPQLPPETVQINDYTYQVPRGTFVQVPAEVARILHEAGKFNIPG